MTRSEKPYSFKESVQELNLSIYDLIPFVPYCLFLAAFVDKNPILGYDSTIVFSFFASMTGIGLVLLCYKIRPMKLLHTKNTADHKKIDSKTKNFYLIFGGIYVIIAALAITNGIDTFIDTDVFKATNSLQGLPAFLTSGDTIIFLSFLSIAILFYNCGIIFLSEEGFRYLTRNEDESQKKIIFCNVLILFSEAIILYFIAYSVASFTHFVLWVMVLLSVDVVWVFIQRFIFLGGKNKSWNDEVPFEWIHLDLLVFGFLWFVLAATDLQQPDQIAPYFYWLVLIVFFFRTTVDYLAMWNRIWSKFSHPLSY